MANFDLEARLRQLNAELSSKFQETGKISLDCLLFDPEGESNKEKTDRLVEIFKREDAFQTQQESLLKACSVDGTTVGFCGWTVIERNRDRQIEATDGQADELRTRGKVKEPLWVPETIDIDGWTALSIALETERRRVLKDLKQYMYTKRKGWSYYK